MQALISAALAATLVMGGPGSAAAEPTFVDAVTSLALAAAAGKKKLPASPSLPVRSKRAEGPVYRGDRLPQKRLKLKRLKVVAVMIELYVTFPGHPGPQKGLRLSLVFLEGRARLFRAMPFLGEEGLPKGLRRFAALERTVSALIRGLSRSSRTIWFNDADAGRCGRAQSARQVCQFWLEGAKAARRDAIKALLAKAKGRRFVVGSFGEVGPLALDAAGKPHYIEVDIARRGKGFVVELIKVK
jgi:hypothetical protein